MLGVVIIQGFEYFSVNEDGSQAKIDSFEAESTKVYIIVDHDQRIISLWKGAKAPVRLKFIGSRASNDTRKDIGFHYKTSVEDEADETTSFKTRVMGMDAESPSDRPTPGSILDADDSPGFTSYAEAAAKQGITISDEEVRKKTASPGAVAGMGGLGSRPQASFLASDAMSGSGSPAPLTKKQVYSAVQTDSDSEAKTILEELGEPKGYSREMVVVGSKVYRLSGSAGKVEFKNLDNPLDGIIMIKDYIPRIIAEGGRVKAIELLKRTSEETVDDEMMTQDLADLTAMFMIEIE